MRVDRVVLEVTREGADEELVEHTAVVHIQVVLDIVVTPVGQVTRAVVDRVMPVAPDETHGIGQHDAGDSVSRRDADTRHHRLLVFLGDKPGVELDKVRMIVQTAKRVSNAGVGVDVLERLVWLEPKVLSELVQACHVPLPALDDAQNFDSAHGGWDIACPKRAGAVFDARGDALDEVVVAELAVRASLEPVERPLERILGEHGVELGESHDQVLDRDLGAGLLEQVVVKLLDPPVVLLRDAAVPSVAEVEFS